MRGKPLVLVQLDNGCIVSTSHKLNQDGYLRVRDDRVTRKGRRPLIMMHRLVWERVYGAVPEGYEVHHKCHNRACCCLEHLELVKTSEHKKYHNHNRYISRKEAAKRYWLEHNCTGVELGKVYGVSDSAVCSWIREWKCRD